MKLLKAGNNSPIISDNVGNYKVIYPAKMQNICWFLAFCFLKKELQMIVLLPYYRLFEDVYLYILDCTHTC